MVEVIEELELVARASKLAKKRANLVNMPNPNCELLAKFLVKLLVCHVNNVAFPKESLSHRLAVLKSINIALIKYKNKRTNKFIHFKISFQENRKLIKSIIT